MPVIKAVEGTRKRVRIRARNMNDWDLWGRILCLRERAQEAADAVLATMTTSRTKTTYVVSRNQRQPTNVYFYTDYGRACMRFRQDHDKLKIYWQEWVRRHPEELDYNIVHEDSHASAA